MGKRSVLNVRLPREKPSDHPDHPDFRQYARGPFIFVTPYRTIIDRGGRKRRRKSTVDANHTTEPTPAPTLTPAPSTSRVQQSDHITDASIADNSTADAFDQHFLDNIAYSPVPDSPPPPPSTHRQLGESARSPGPASIPPSTARRQTYPEYITLEAELRKSQRAKLLGRFLEFRDQSNLRLQPLVSEDDPNDQEAPPPCACSHTLAREVIMYDYEACTCKVVRLMGFSREFERAFICESSALSVHRVQITFCASEPPCLTDAERLAQLGFMSATAFMPVTAFSFRLMDQSDSKWKVSPGAVTGHVDGIANLHFDRMGWGRNHYNGHKWDKELRKQFQRAVDEFQALEAVEHDVGEQGTTDSPYL
ncbi:BZ3500_MvSof-1268-A1-R1_Chr1-1g01189 [Microbotryum saponariae]|uniref:BZ3500_MvSof-1268-A1-R1_Chr1-1g01189 protein n=1 Tax=Microbotryum saponariae TaxID=289078 RepID=A0A2X0L1M3_9BASI|nr:BZ3500_MvSof-1268-A1-R1_Chr1-1g01189 [Microbotryum saponariae]SCZ93615.1 BZ3501_MvSof-1269-A2-R1_Chr1-1g00785 [Microbotryum saponariae]